MAAPNPPSQGLTIPLGPGVWLHIDPTAAATPAPEDDWVSARELARRLGVSRKTVERLLDRYATGPDPFPVRVLGPRTRRISYRGALHWLQRHPQSTSPP